MTHRPIRCIIEHQTPLTATADLTVHDAALLMKSNGVGAIMIIDNNMSLVGIFTERDALYRVMAEGRDPNQTRLAEVMTIHPQSIAPHKPLSHALHLMYEGNFRHVPVVENGHIIGIVSARDALATELIEFESDLLQREHIREILW